MKKWALAAACVWSSAHAFVPSAGTWLVDEEINGKPGRGISMDVQNHILGMQVFAYEQNGEPTFYMATGSLNKNTANMPLSRYKGGRYLGSGDRTGVETASPGNVSVRFTSSTTGYIRFPGEAEKAISRFEFGYSRSDAASLMGTWSFFGGVAGTNTINTDVEVHNNQIGPTSASGAGMVVSKNLGFACEQQISGALAGLTLCIRMSTSGTAQRAYLIRWSLHDGEGDLMDKNGNPLGAAFARRLIDGRSNGTGLLRNAEADDEAKMTWDAESVKRQFLDTLASY